MAGRVIVFAAIMFSAVAAGNPPAGEKPSAALGKNLFRDATLGRPRNTRSCNTCHPDGKGLKDAGSNPDLPAIINRCITGPLVGKKIPVDSTEMQSLVLYIRSLKN